MKLSVHVESWPAARPFRITGREWTSFDSVVVELEQGGAVGRGEGLGVYYLDETPASMTAQVETIAARIEAGIDRAALQSLLPPGGARNSVDCALWDLEAKRSGRRIWELAGLEPRPLETVFTIGLEATPEAMAAKAAAAAGLGLLKVKLDGTQPLERMRAIRQARPDALGIDALRLAGLGIPLPIPRPVPPAPRPWLLLWQSVHLIKLFTVRGAIRLGTLRLLPMASTGCNEALAGLNSTRVLVWGNWRFTRAGPRATLSAWQRKQSSNSLAMGLTTAPAAFTPFVP